MNIASRLASAKLKQLVLAEGPDKSEECPVLKCTAMDSVEVNDGALCRQAPIAVSCLAVNTATLEAST